ncbi:MAG: hypothetical protein IT423_00745 [Pirellulaceae bacterium]|nr:hypothetical protein [Pirellulaceae bacterium]
MARADRRRFVFSSMVGSSAVASGLATGLGTAGGWLAGLPELRAEDVQLEAGAVQFRQEIEPLVRLIEASSRETVLDKVLAEVHAGRTYRELLAAMFLAGIRNVQPRPAVGFKFHCVLAVYATHQASMAALDNERWLPLLWAIDNFKSAQATDVREGNWTMAKVDESRLPTAEKSLAALAEALENWDVEAADAAAAAAARTASRSQLLDIMARYASRDFRSIGHKAIYVAAAFRTLEVIGWEHAEPIVRSLAYAILNHQGDENPSKHDYAVDRAGRENWQLASTWTTPWQVGRIDSPATLDLLKMLRSTEPTAASKVALECINGGVHPRSVSDAVSLASAELVMRQPGIVPLHAVTTTNALTYLAASVADERLRKWLLLQNVAFLSHFTEAAKARGKLPENNIDALEAKQSTPPAVESVFGDLASDKAASANAIFQLAQDPASAYEVVRAARHLVFLKGTDAHDYKFSSAALEDYQLISPKWRAHYLAGCSYLFKNANDKTSPLAKRAGI